MSTLFVAVPDRRRRHPPWATIAIMCLCLAVYALLLLLPGAPALAWVTHWGVVPARLFAPLVAQAPWHQWIQPDWLSLLTALFIHAAWAHLLANMLFLLIFGLATERALGSLRFLALFLAGGVLANFCGALSLMTAQAPIVGCSGAVSAVIGVYLVLFPRARLGVVLPLGLFVEFVRVPAALLIGLWVLLQLLFSYAGPDFGAVVWWSHIAGFVFGVLFGAVCRGGVMRRQRG